MAPHRGTSAFVLKMAAIAGMTCNHVANIFATVMPGWLTVLLCLFGGLTFPIMAFLLCEGYRHTSNIRRYATRLAAFAVVSQVPYSLLWGATANVLVTLLIGLGLLWAFDHLRSRLAFAALFAAGIAASSVCDWGIIGPVMICLFYWLRERPHGVALAMLVPALALALPVGADLAEGLATWGAAAGGLTVQSPWEVLAALPGAAHLDQAAFTINQAGPFITDLGALAYYTAGFALATALMITYNGRRGRPLKWFFYVYYPAHLLALWVLAQVVLPLP